VKSTPVAPEVVLLHGFTGPTEKKKHNKIKKHT